MPPGDTHQIFLIGLQLGHAARHETHVGTLQRHHHRRRWLNQVIRCANIIRLAQHRIARRLPPLQCLHLEIRLKTVRLHHWRLIQRVTNLQLLGDARLHQPQRRAYPAVIRFGIHVDLLGITALHRALD